MESSEVEFDLSPPPLKQNKIAELVNEKPNTYGKVMPEILEPPEPILQEIGERLAGLY